MATLQHSLIFRLLEILLYSSLLLALFPCFTEKSKAMANTEAHFHNVQISSLLPAAICSHSTGSTQRQRQSAAALEVHHNHGPCFSQQTQTKSSPPPLSNILAHDQSRVKSIQARINPSPSPSPFKNTKSNLPAQPGRSFNTGNYIVIVRLGTPEKPLSLVFDTGSDLTWTQCQPCARSCYNQRDPIFNPSSSTSYSNISCTSPQCPLLSSATGINPGCSGATCLYAVQYGDTSYSVGFFSKDKLTVTQQDVFPDFLFGCGEKNQGLFGSTAGLLGLGRDPLSFVAQTAEKYGQYFSYCLPSVSSLTGHLAFGKSGSEAPNNVKFTPFAGSRGNSFYFVEIVSIYVGGAQVAIDRSVFQTAGSIIDSGTVITRLAPGAYGPMSAAFRRLMGKYARTGAYSLLDTCYDLGNATSIVIPAVKFVFEGDVEVELAASGILVAVGPTTVCLAFAGNSRETDVGIFGNTQQKTLEVVYDVAGGKLGFGAGGCE
ncbi:eukaryotic aspartyl protease family protein [Striga asiatica]|uniref:Eukaryotic aspartyl protease family protein n=1 Tax=Striga asiatica TaxID=4170 RepID=A0A5A7PP44_STRAF|nr:eukaryotic aspartyl protease family protein [Striga asiatica]